jgi:hypothetical protein
MVNLTIENVLVETLLHAGEQAELAVRGTVIASPRLALRSWLIVLTSQRLVCAKGRGVPWPRVIDIPRSTIRHVSVKRTVGGPELRVVTGQGELVIRLSKDAAFLLQRALEGDMAHVPAPRAIAGHAVGAPRTSAVTRAESPAMESLSIEQIAAVVEHLETDVARLRQQVEFLEALMERRNTTPAVPF